MYTWGHINSSRSPLNPAVISKILAPLFYSGDLASPLAKEAATLLAKTHSQLVCVGPPKAQGQPRKQAAPEVRPPKSGVRPPKAYG